MFGDIMYQLGNYVERLLADEQGVRVVLCTTGITTKLYRIEWSEPDGYGRNQATYDLLSTIQAFQQIVQQVQEQNANAGTSSYATRTTPLPLPDSETCFGMPDESRMPKDSNTIHFMLLYDM